MFCPGCGIEEVHSNQFCRGCGSDLRRVRTALATADPVTASASAARDEIGRAIAMKIRDTRSAEELSVVAEEVLPQIEKFLESPEEKRLRRMRTGMILSSIGMGAAIGITLASFFMRDNDIMIMAGLGVVAFFIGLGFILNGVFLTVPKQVVNDRSDEGDVQRQLDARSSNTNDLQMPSAPSFLAGSGINSVTENTTRHLDSKDDAQNAERAR